MADTALTRRVRPSGLPGANAIRALLFERPLALLYGVVLFVSLIKFGLAPTPNIGDWTAIARSPIAAKLRLADPSSQYLFGSPLGALLCRAIGIRSSFGFYLFHAVVVVTVLFGTMRAVAKNYGRFVSGAIAVMWFATPVSNVLFSMVGQPDPFTFAAATTLTISRRRWPLFIAALVLGFNHLQQGVVIIIASIAMRAILHLTDDGTKNHDAPSPDESIPSVAAKASEFSTFLQATRWMVSQWTAVAAIVAGMPAGRVAWEFFARHYGIDTDGRALFLKATGVTNVLRNASNQSLIFTVATFGVAWPLIIGAIRTLRNQRLLQAVVCLLLVGMLIPTALTLDLSRVYVMMSWPVVLGLVIVWIRRTKRAKAQSWLSVIFAISLLAPHVVVLGTLVYTSRLADTVEWLQTGKPIHDAPPADSGFSTEGGSRR
jgi:hypothetical protein